MKAEDAVSAGISRRRFFKSAGRALWGGVLMSSGLVFPVVGSNAFASADGGRPMDYLKYSTFSRLIGEKFKKSITANMELFQKRSKKSCQMI